MIERERACDEMVLAAGHDAGTYGASILKVCRFAVPGPLGITAGVLGLDLKSRVGSILDGCTAIPMNGARKWLLAAAGAAPLIASTRMAFCIPGQGFQSSRLTRTRQRCSNE